MYYIILCFVYSDGQKVLKFHLLHYRAVSKDCRVFSEKEHAPLMREDPIMVFLKQLCGAIHVNRIDYLKIT